jgi:hypothetical protein
MDITYRKVNIYDRYIGQQELSKGKDLMCASLA